MGFFDLNIPYDMPSSSSLIRAIRIKIVAKLMELGYSGLAYNHTIKGVMSDQDRCSILPLNVSSLHSILPSFSASVEFHRDLLGVPRSSPFRQYTRLTICIENVDEISAINSGNLILKTYDLIAVKPLNQYALEHACEKLEIDIIVIDFAERLPFKLKYALIKSAIQRGVYFEIMYSSLLLDVYERRQMIYNVKLLVEWTKGKNLILSSAAYSVNEIRGPYDVANLSSLLGVSMERAKAAISKNCRNLIANALKRNQFYKDTIRVERISSDDKVDLNDPWSVDSFKWDPISSGEGDMLLDDIAKSFAASSQNSKSVKAIDFTSVINNMPPQGFLVKNVISDSEAKLLNNYRDLSHVADAIEPSGEVNGEIQLSHTLFGVQCSTSNRQNSKSFPASSQNSKFVKPIDFTSVINNMPPQGFLVKNVISDSEAKLLNNDIDLSHVADAIEPSGEANGEIQLSHTLFGVQCSTSNRQNSKSFATPSKNSKYVNAKNVIFGSEAKVLKYYRDLSHVADAIEPSGAVNGVIQQSHSSVSKKRKKKKLSFTYYREQCSTSNRQNSKSFAASSQNSKYVKPIDFTSAINNMPPQGFLVKNVISDSEAKLLNNSRDLSHVVDAIEPSSVANGVIQLSHTLDGEQCSTSNRQNSKSFATPSKNSKYVKPIDFTSVINNMSPQGFRIKNVISGYEAKLLNNYRDLSHVADAIEPSGAVNGVIQPSHTIDGVPCFVCNHPCSVMESSKVIHSHGEAGKLSSSSEEDKTIVEEIVQSKISMQEPIEMDIDNVEPQNLPPSSQLNVVSTNELHSPTSTGDVLAGIFENDGKKTFRMSEDVDSHQNEYGLNSSENVLRVRNPTNLVSENQKNVSVVIDGTFTAEECLLGARLGEPGDVAVAEDQVSPISSCASNVKDDYLISVRQPTSELLIEEQKSTEADLQITPPPLDQSISGVMSTENAGKYPAEQMRHQPMLRDPLKQLINPLAFKKVHESNAEKYQLRQRRDPQIKCRDIPIKTEDTSPGATVSIQANNQPSSLHEGPQN